MVISKIKTLTIRRPSDVIWRDYDAGIFDGHSMDKETTPDLRFENFDNRVSTDESRVFAYRSSVIDEINEECVGIFGRGNDVHPMKRQTPRRWKIGGLEAMNLASIRVISGHKIRGGASS